MSTDGVTAGGGGSTICTMAMLVCVCPRVSVCVYQCASMSVCIQLRLVLNAGLTLAHSFLPPSILPKTVPSPPPRHPLSVSQMLIHKCRLPGKVINDGSCGPSHSPSLPDLVLPLLFLVACLHHSLRREINIQGQGGGEESDPMG